MEVNGKFYPFWGQFVEKKEQFIGSVLEDYGDSMDRALLGVSSPMQTTVKDIVLVPNGTDSAMFNVVGEAFTCGFDVRYGGVVAGENGWITFGGYGDHKFRIKTK